MKVPFPILICIGLAGLLQPAASYGQYTVTVPITESLAREALDPALMCGAIYRNNQVYGWEGPYLQIEGRDTFDDVSGLAAGIFERSHGQDREVALCFRGTDSLLPDWKANFNQAVLGDVPDQYREGVALAQLALIRARKAAPSGNVRFFITGHSLGGGIAALSGGLLGQRTYGFASAPLGEGSQQVLGASRMHAAKGHLTHFFMREDLVPASSMAFGVHCGRIAQPYLEPPPNWSGAMTRESRLDYLRIFGINGDGSPYLNGKLLAVQLMKEGVNQLARHSMDSYIGGLVMHLGSNSAGLNLAGVWESKGTFYQLSKSTTHFTMTANGRLVLTTATDISVPLLDLNERIIDVKDTGQWRFDGRWLDFTVGGIAILRYELTATEPNRVAQWRRASLEPDLAGLTRMYQAEGAEDPQASAQGAALLLKGVFFLMRNKVVTWTRDPNSPQPGALP